MTKIYIIHRINNKFVIYFYNTLQFDKNKKGIKKRFFVFLTPLTEIQKLNQA